MAFAMRAAEARIDAIGVNLRHAEGMPSARPERMLQKPLIVMHTVGVRP